ncbi:fibrocystin isoform X1 [Pelobates cultripes]|uniref:Fibrocystin isoform X1 n=1 Tax=Pelobates cultripes TaxID=61616 RepID=A0AAD1VRH7_PELCU|nr:fibrocystin isoform X1 [Pelobates cultripes]
MKHNLSSGHFLSSNKNMYSLSTLRVLQTFLFIFYCMSYTIDNEEGGIAGGSWITILFNACEQNKYNLIYSGNGDAIEVRLTNPQLGLAICDVHPSLSSLAKNKCKTRSSKEEAVYQLDVLLDGHAIKQKIDYTFKYSAAQTPVVDNVSPSASVPGGMIKVSGRILTEQTECYDFNSDCIDGYPIKVKHGYGTLECKVEGNYIGSQNISFSLYKKGKSIASKDSWLISAKQELFLFQTHSEILSVTPNSGSIEGGTEITIIGDFFQQPAQVSVAGDPCKIKHISPKVIVCTSEQRSRRQVSPYPGNRGLLFEVWYGSKDVTVTDKYAGYRSALVSCASSPMDRDLALDSPMDTDLGLEQHFRARLSGFFMAPETNNYTFWIQANTEAELYFSQSEDARDKVRIASIPYGISTWTNHWELQWNDQWQQKSFKLELLKGNKHYIEMVQHGNELTSNMKIGVQIHNTWLNPDVVNTYQREKHQIVARSARLPDIQILTLSGAGEIRFCWGNASTISIPVNVTAGQMQSVIEDMLSIHCITEGSFAILLHEGFEEEVYNTGMEGEQARWTEPYCGRASAFMPKYLLKAFQTKSARYKLNEYNYVCFAYKGYMSESLVISVSYNKTFLNTVQKNYTCHWQANEENPERWKFACIDLWNCLNDSDLLEDLSRKSSVFVDQVLLLSVKNMEETKNWFYVDDIIVSNGSIHVSQVGPPPARPGGHILESFVISGSYPTYNLTSWISNCGTSLPLIELCGGSTVVGSAEDNEIKQLLAPGNETIELKVQRLQSASPPIRGTFIIKLLDRAVTGIPVKISPSQLKEILISNTDNYTAQYINASDFTITKDLDTCHHIIWTLTWPSTDGDLPNLFSVYAENLTGVAPSVRMRVIYDGGVFIWPVFGDMLATANSLPQVVVRVNDIPASCSGNCSFLQLQEFTPIVTDIQYNGGVDECYGKVTISGSGFSENKKDLDIQINQTSCTIIYANRTSILCCVEQLLLLGEHRVLLHVNPFGFATNSTGKYIYLNLIPVLSRVIPAVIASIGGQIVVLRGIALNEVTLVYFGSKECLLHSSNSTTIECTAPPQHHNAELETNITMKIGEQWVLFTKRIKYDPALNPLILLLSPNVSGPAGDHELFINMSAFDINANLNIKVTVESTAARITRLTTSGIEVIIPELPTGLYNVNVAINGISIATRYRDPIIRYILNTFIVEPCCGSFFGRMYESQQESHLDGRHGQDTTSQPSSARSSDGFVVVQGLEEGHRELAVMVVRAEVCPISISILNYTAEYINSGSSNKSHLLFTYQKDLTPVVSNLSWILLDETLLVFVSGFHLTNSLILFENSHSKLIYKLNYIEMEISLNDFEAGRYHIMIYNRQMGYANIASQDPILNLVPLVHSIFPLQGSLCGGTILTISGTLFKSINNSITVNLSGNYTCNVQNFSNRSIECTIQSNVIQNISSLVYVNVSVTVNGFTAICQSDCIFHMVTEQTPVVNSYLITLEGNTSIFHFLGHRLSMDLNVLLENGTPCNITFSNETMAECQLTCVPPGNHTLNILNVMNEKKCFSNFPFYFSITPWVTNLSRVHFGFNGGGLLTIQGSALLGQNYNYVYIGNKRCVNTSNSHVIITCIVPPGNGMLDVIVEVDNLKVLAGAVQYSELYTPVVHSFLKHNNTLTLAVSGITSLENIQIFVGNLKCANLTGNTSTVQCSVPDLPSGQYKVKCLDEQRGWASSNITFTTPLIITALKHNIDDADNWKLHVHGEGFDPGNTLITMCGTPCEIKKNLTTSDIYCTNWRLNSSLTFLCDLTYDAGAQCYKNSNTYIQCDVTVQNTDDTQLGKLLRPNAKVLECSFSGDSSYDWSWSDNESQGGGGGCRGSLLPMNPKVERDEVLIYNGSCYVSMAAEAEIECKPLNQPITTKITEIQKNWGQNTQAECGREVLCSGNIFSLHFCSLWSKNSSWPSGVPPLDGDNVTVEIGRTLILDTNTSLLNLLHIKGGTHKDTKAAQSTARHGTVHGSQSRPVHLHAHYVLVSHGGMLQAGSPTEPLTEKIQITLYGSSSSATLNPYGVKFIAVRNGTLLLHGCVPKLMFTHLAKEAFAQGAELTLEEPVDWHIGDEVIICGVGFKDSSLQEEIVRIEKINNAKISISPPLSNHKSYYRISEQFVDGQVILLRPVVALLSRNIVVQGNLTKSYITRYQLCLQSGISDISKCLYDRSERELGSQDLGSVIIMQALQNEQNHFQISGVQFLNMGQAFKKQVSALTIAGNTHVSGCYVRRCSILNSFARGLSISGVSGFKVEDNIFYNIRGHGLLVGEYIEEDIEIKRNLLIRILGTNALSNIEMLAPAAVYIKAPSNTIENDNTAWNAGYGYFYHLSPDGPSVAPLQSFRKNTAVSCLRYGLWLYPDYQPPNNEPKAVFQGFSAWRSGGGAQISRCGNVYFKEFNIYSCKDFGINIIESTLNTEIGDSLLLGHLDKKFGYTLFRSHSQTGCMKTGIKTPKRFQSFLTNITFMNFDHAMCSAIEPCSGCSLGQGGFTVMSKQLKFLNSPKQANFPFHHSAIIEDLDGSFFGLKGSHLLFSMSILPDSCSEYLNISGAVLGSICGEEVIFHRMSIGLERAPGTSYNVIINNSMNKTMTLNYVEDTLSNEYGWMALLVDKETYTITFNSTEMSSTLQYSATFDNFRIGNYILVEHKDLPNFENINITCDSQIGRPFLSLNLSGESRPCDWSFDSSLRTLTYLAFEENHSKAFFFTSGNSSMSPQVLMVPSARPHPVLKWSFPASWEGVGKGWGGYNSTTPQAGNDVIILPNRTIVVDIALPSLRSLYVLGTLEFPPHSSNVLNVSCILIAGGELRVGTAQRPLARDQKLQILLRSSEEIHCDRLDGFNISSGVIGVFGTLQIYSAFPSKTWTHLKTDVSSGNQMIVLTESVDWKTGDHIVISSSSYEAHHAEFVQIREVYGNVFKIGSSLRYRHTGGIHSNEEIWRFQQSAEVGLLSRNVQITADVACVGRIVVGEFKVDNEKKYLGTLQVSNVEISNFGSSLYSSINFLNTSLPSSLLSVSIHHSCGGGIRALNGRDIVLHGNVIFNTVGHGIQLEGQNHNLTNNLLVLIKQPDLQQEWVTAIKMNLVNGFFLSGNAVAGSERIGFHVKGQLCSLDDRLSYVNVAHSSLHGLHFYWGDGFQNCTKIAGYVAYKNYDYGLIFHLESSVIIENIILMDNVIGILPVISQVSSEYNRKYISIQKSVIVATSPGFDCTMDRIKPLSADATARDRAPRPPLRGRVGILWPTFTAKPQYWSSYPWHMLGRYGAVPGLMKLQDVTFSGFMKSCYSDDVDVCFMSNPQNTGIMSPITTERTSVQNMKYENMFYFHSTNRDPECPLSMECYGLGRVLFKDLDGMSLNLVPPPVTVFPKADLSILLPCLNSGVYKKNNLCSYKPGIKGHVCQQIDHAVVVLENIGDNYEQLAPVISVTENFVDVFSNGNISKGGCCTKNIHSSFYAVLPANKITKVCFNGPTPQNMRLQLNGGQNTTKLILALFYDTPQTVSILSKGRLTFSVSYDAQPDFFNENQGIIFFNFKENLLYVLLQGDEPVVISTNPSLHLALYVTNGTSMKIGKEFPKNLAEFLGIGNTQVTILQTLQGDMKTLRAMTDNHVKRKLQCPSISDLKVNKKKIRVRRNSGTNGNIDSLSKNEQNNLEVILIEISNPPILNTNGGSFLTYDKLYSIENRIISGLQTGELEGKLHMHIDSLMIMDPVQSKLGSRSRNSSELEYDINVYVRPQSIRVDVQPMGGVVGKPLAVQPKVTVLDEKGNRVENLGYPLNHWQLSVFLKDSSSTSLKGNTTVVIKDGWGNFSNLAISSSGSNWCLIFNVTSPPGVMFTAQSEEFKVLLVPTRDKENIFMLVVLSSAASATALFLLFCCFFKRKKVERLKNGKTNKR